MKLYRYLVLSVFLIGAGGQAAEEPAPKPAGAPRLSAQTAETAAREVATRQAVRRQHG